MKLTIGKKLAFCFFILGLLVFISGIVGIYVLNRVSRSADTVAKEKAPVRYAVSQAELAVDKAEKEIADYGHSHSDLAEKEMKLMARIDEFEMWIAMLELGTSSETFKKSAFFKTYQKLGLTINVPKSSPELTASVKQSAKDGLAFRQGCLEIMDAHKEYLKYAFISNGKSWDLPSYLLFLRHYLTEWFNSLESVVVSVTRFEKNTDLSKGPFREWINNYKIEDDGLNKLMEKVDKYHRKLLDYAVKINEEKEFEKKEKLLKRNTGNFARIKKGFEQIDEYVEPIYQELNQIKEQKLDTLNRAAVNMNKALEVLVKAADKEMETALKNAEASRNRGSVILIVLTAAAVLAALVLGLHISRYLSSSITAIAGITRQIAAGDLRNKVKISSSDELGELAEDTNIMTDNLKKMIGRITEFSRQLSNESSDLTKLSVSMSDSAKDMTVKSESVAAAAEQMSSNMTSVSSSSEVAANNINTVSIATDGINSSITEIAQNAEKGNSITGEAVERADSATKRVNELGSAAREISKVTEVISEISEQTNLLALNATIEAARAGEAGKGFAVVASEIKQLALQTANATNDIKVRIESIQSSTSETVREIEGVAQVIQTVNEIVGTIAAAVEEQSATTREIAENMVQASGGLQDMSDNIYQSTSVANEIANDIADVNKSSNEVLMESKQVSRSSSGLKTLSENLSELISKFKL